VTADRVVLAARAVAEEAVSSTAEEAEPVDKRQYDCPDNKAIL
jgi:hypothetical protein